MALAEAVLDVPDLKLQDLNSVPTVFDHATRRKRGWCQVAANPLRGKGPVNLYYELHGSEAADAHRLIFIMGLNNSCFGWFKQLPYFTKRNYSILVFDNRGVGQSDSPKGRYTTSEMARDVEELLDFIGWTQERSINLVGVSMGGMIAQQVALQIPLRLKSLMLVSTKAGDRFDLPTRTSVNLFARMLSGTAGKTPEELSRLVMSSLFPDKYLDAEDEGNPGHSNRERVEDEFYQRSKITKLQTTRGKVGQTAAVLTHKVTSSKLKIISETVPKIAIIVGDQDGLIDYRRSLEIHEMMPGSTLKVIIDGGHALPSQLAPEFNAWVEEVVESAA